MRHTIDAGGGVRTASGGEGGGTGCIGGENPQSGGGRLIFQAAALKNKLEKSWQEADELTERADTYADEVKGPSSGQLKSLCSLAFVLAKMENKLSPIYD